MLDLENDCFFFLVMANVIESKYQCALMCPTEILSKQHYNLAMKIFKNKF